MNSVRAFKRILIAGFLLTAASSAVAADVGVSISVGQPGFYGRIDVGDYPYPQPRVIYSRPIIVHRGVEMYDPIYLRVPPGHSRNWDRYCDRYDACGRPVYFVNDSWYNEIYVPQYYERRGEEYHYRNDRGHDRGYGEDRRERHDEGRGEGRGRGRGHDRD